MSPSGGAKGGISWHRDPPTLGTPSPGRDTWGAPLIPDPDFIPGMGQEPTQTPLRPHPGDLGTDRVRWQLCPLPARCAKEGTVTKLPVPPHGCRGSGDSRGHGIASDSSWGEPRGALLGSQRWEGLEEAIPGFFWDPKGGKGWQKLFPSSFGISKVGRGAKSSSRAHLGFPRHFQGFVQGPIFTWDRPWGQEQFAVTPRTRTAPGDRGQVSHQCLASLGVHPVQGLQARP